MRVLHLLTGLISIFRVVLAQELLAGYPTCAVACLLQSLPQTSCSPTDVSCLCESQSLWDSATVCTVQQCTTREALTAQKLSKRACGAPVRNRASTLPIVNTILTGIAAVFVILRIVARSPRNFELLEWDDGFIVLCFLAGSLLTVSHFFLSHNGLGQDIWEVPFANIDRMLFWFYLTEPFYLASTVLMKISILFFYLRVFVDEPFRRVVYVVMSLCIAYAIAFFFSQVFQCSPISYAWTHWDGKVQGKCIDVNAGAWAHAATNILFDLIVLALPLPQLVRLKFTYSWKSKAQIAIMFGIGLLVTVVSALRLGELVRFANTSNPTWDYWGPALWSGIEVWIGVICACLPTARVFVGRMLPKWLGLSYGSATNTHNQTAKLHKRPTAQILSWKTPHEPSRLANGDASFVELGSRDGPDEYRSGTAV